MSCGADWGQFVDAATVRSRGAEASVGQPFGKCAATYQVDGPLGRLMVAEVDCVVVAMAAAPPELAIQRSYDVAFAAADQLKLTELARFDAPAAGAISEGATLLQETGVPTVTEALALLLLTLGSLVFVVIAASSAAVLPGAVAVLVTGDAAPAASDERVQTTESPFTLHDQPLPDADADGTPERLLRMVTFCAVLGPLFAALSVKVTVPPLLTGFGAALIVSATSAESVMATFAVPEAEQEPLVIATPMVAVPLLPAVQTIDGVPLPLVIVPPEMVQL